MLALGAQFVLTGSINQCTPQAATSDAVKDLLVTLGVHDTAMAPAADLFEVDGRVQVVRRGTLFAARANRLQRVYREHRSWHDVDAVTRASIERQILKGSYDEVLASAKRRYASEGSERLRLIESDPHAEMAAVFKTYLVRTTVAAAEGRTDESSDFQIHCGPALGAFNKWVSGTAMKDWHHRDVDVVADTLLAAVQSGRQSETDVAPTPTPTPTVELTG
jgi:trans-AT polyketide synthase/acyltransferase/oxidoreductase domain-containing protein